MKKVLGTAALLAIAGASYAQKTPPTEQPWVFAPKNSSPAMTLDISPSGSSVVEGNTVDFTITAGDLDTYEGSRTRNGTVEYKDEFFRSNAWSWSLRNFDQNVFEMIPTYMPPTTTPLGDESFVIRIKAKPDTGGTYKVIWVDMIDSPNAGSAAWNALLDDEDKSKSFWIAVNDAP